MQIRKKAEGMNKYEKNPKRYAEGLAEQVTTSHPWGKGAASEYTAKGLVNHAEQEGLTDKYIAKKLAAIASLTTTGAPGVSRKFRKASNIARARAHKKKQYKSDRVRIRA